MSENNVGANELVSAEELALAQASARRSADDIAAIKDREQQVRAALFLGHARVPYFQFPPAQLGLRPIYADMHGHLWRDDGGYFTKLGYAAGRPG